MERSITNLNKKRESGLFKIPVFLKNKTKREEEPTTNNKEIEKNKTVKAQKKENKILMPELVELNDQKYSNKNLILETSIQDNQIPLFDNKEYTKNPQQIKENSIINLTIENNPIIKNGFFTYYCSLCGSLLIKSSIILDKLPRRRTDESIICLIGKLKIESFLNKGKLIIIHRGNNKYEKQYTFICKSCNTLVAYQSNDYDDEKQDEAKEKQLALFGKKLKKIFYILSDALVIDPKQSTLSIEIENIKNNKTNPNTISQLFLNNRIKKK